MNPNWAEQNLQTIRTLMERSAVYRHALAPIMILTGLFGITAALVGLFLHIGSARLFVAYWMTVGLVTVAGGFLLIRKQALKSAEPVWSPPTRRVVQAMLPPMAVGLFAGLLGLLPMNSRPADAAGIVILWCFAYGCAVHAAGFFMPRGIKLLGWLFIIAGAIAATMLLLTSHDYPSGGHGSPFDVFFDERGLFMGSMFGGIHLIYGIYLYFSEKGKNAA